MTGTIFLCAFLFAIGRGFAWFFRKLNPFFMIIGFMLFGIPLADVFQNGEWYMVGAVLLGMITFYFNPLSLVDGLRDIFSRPWSVKADSQREQTRDYYREDQTDNSSAHYEEAIKESANRARDKAQAEYDEHVADRERDLKEKVRQAQEDIKRREEELRRQQEAFHKQKSSAESKSQSASEKNGLDPTKLADAYRILGITPETPKAEAKKAIRRLRSIYSPDKVNNLGEERRLQAEEEMKVINIAWDRVKNTFKE